MTDDTEDFPQIEDLVVRLRREGKVYTHMAAAQEIERLRKELATATARISELKATFDMMWHAEARAIQKWEIAHPATKRTWPDRRRLTTWLIGRIEHLENILTRIVRQVSDEANGHHTLADFKLGANIDDAQIALRAAGGKLNADAAHNGPETDRRPA